MRCTTSALTSFLHSISSGLGSAGPSREGTAVGAIGAEGSNGRASEMVSKDGLSEMSSSGLSSFTVPGGGSPEPRASDTGGASAHTFESSIASEGSVFISTDPRPGPEDGTSARRMTRISRSDEESVSPVGRTAGTNPSSSVQSTSPSPCSAP